MPLQCPECGSEHVRKVSLLYEDGVQKTKSRTIMGGGLFSIFGPALGIGGAVTRGKNTTLTAERLAPPQRARPILAAVLVFFGFGMFGEIPAIFLGRLLGGKSGETVGLMFFFIALFGVPIYLLVKGFAENRRYPERYASWNSMFACTTCGRVFTREDASPAADGAA